MSEIDARDFGRLEAQVETLHGQVTQLSTDVKALLETSKQRQRWLLDGDDYCFNHGRGHYFYC